MNTGCVTWRLRCPALFSSLPSPTRPILSGNMPHKTGPHKSTDPHLDESVEREHQCKDCNTLIIIAACHTATDVTGHHAHQSSSSKTSASVPALADKAVGCQRAEGAEKRGGEYAHLQQRKLAAVVAAAAAAAPQHTAISLANADCTHHVWTDWSCFVCCANICSCCTWGITLIG